MKRPAVIALALSGSLVSASALATVGWSSNPIPIATVEVHQDEDRVYISFLTQPNNWPTGCVAKAGKWDIMTSSGKAMLSVASAAFVAGRPVTVNWSACTSGYAYIQGISMT